MPAFFDQFLGAEVEFPDSMDPAKQQAALGELYRQRQQQESYQNLGYLGQLIGGMGNQQRTIPRATVTPTAAFAMTPQALQSYMGQQQERLNQEAQMQWASQEKAQERQQQNAIEQARQQAQLKRDIQTEKFRGDQLKLQEMNYKNQKKDRDLRRTMMEDAAKARQEEADRKAAMGKDYSIDGKIVNVTHGEDGPSTRVLYDSPDAPSKPIIQNGQRLVTDENGQPLYYENIPGYGGGSSRSGSATGTVKVPKQYEEFSESVSKYAQMYGVPESTIYAIIQQESGGRPDLPGADGEIGVMQVMPGTARGMGFDPEILKNDVDSQIHAGVKYYANMLKNFGGNKATALAAYNGGPGGTKLKQAQRYAQSVLSLEKNFIGEEKEEDEKNPLIRSIDGMPHERGADGAWRPVQIAGKQELSEYEKWEEGLQQYLKNQLTRLGPDFDREELVAVYSDAFPPPPEENAPGPTPTPATPQQAPSAPQPTAPSPVQSSYTDIYAAPERFAPRVQSSPRVQEPAPKPQRVPAGMEPGYRIPSVQPPTSSKKPNMTNQEYSEWYSRKLDEILKTYGNIPPDGVIPQVTPDQYSRLTDEQKNTLRMRGLL